MPGEYNLNAAYARNPQGRFANRPYKAVPLNQALGMKKIFLFFSTGINL
jgi:hypothetical protein